ncbi:MAG: acyltransferase family protein [Candidatus Limisoma sp.]
MTATNKRIDSFDMLKGIAIFLVVMGHVLTMCIRQIDSAIAFKIIGQIHMPVFFFISGWFSYKTSDGNVVAPNLWRRARQLLIPFFVVSALWVVYFPHSGLRSPMTGSIPSMLTSFWKDGYWFTPTLMVVILLYWAMAVALRRVKSLTLWIIASIAVYVGLIVVSPLVNNPDNNHDPFCIAMATQFFPTFVVGALCHKSSNGFRRLTENHWIVFAATVVGAFCWYHTAYPWEFAALPDLASHLTLPMFHFCLMLVAFSLVYRYDGKKEDSTDATAKPSRVRMWFVLQGNKSLGIYLLHYFFLFPLTCLQEPMRQLSLALVPSLVVSAAVALCVVTVTLGVIYVIENNKILTFLILGK